MNRILGLVAAAALVLSSGIAIADNYDETIQRFKESGQSADFFKDSYGYAVFPTIGKAGLGVGGSHGKGKVYKQGQYVGDSSVTKLSVGFQAGGQAYSQIIFFEDQRAFDDFTSGDFEFGADVNAVAITASAGAQAGSTGKSTSVSAGKNDAKTKGEYRKGLAVFTVVKGGAMYEASVAGQKYKFKPVDNK